jgi:hypothetical protein
MRVLVSAIAAALAACLPTLVMSDVVQLVEGQAGAA